MPQIDPNPASARHRPRRLLRALAAVAVSAIAFGVLPISPANADDVTGISGAPANETGPDQRSRFSYQIAPGQTLTDNYVAINSGTGTQTMKVFATDAYNTDDGGYGLLETATTPADAGNWVTFGGQKSVTVTLGPGAQQVIPFTVTVPADAGPGDHAAGIVVSMQSGDGAILVDRRVATRLYVRVPGDLQASLTVASISASYDPTLNPLDGTTSITITYRNSGNVALSGNLVAAVNTYFGIQTGQLVRTSVAEMLPGSTRTVTVPVHGVGQWGYLNPYVRLAPTVDAEALNPGPLSEVDRDTVIAAMPWWLVILLVVAALIVGLVWLRRRIDRKRTEQWIAYTEAEARRRSAEDAAKVTSDSGR